VFRRVEIIFDFKKAIKPVTNKAIMYYQIPHKVLFKRHPHTGRCHMTYAVFSDEPMQPPEPRFDGSTLCKSVNSVEMKPLCLVGGRAKFLTHLGVPQDVASMSKTQSDTLATMTMLESQGVFDQLQQDVLAMKVKRCHNFVLPLHLLKIDAIMRLTDLILKTGTWARTVLQAFQSLHTKLTTESRKRMALV